MLLIRVIEPFGYYIDRHEVGEVFAIGFENANHLIKCGLAEIVVNNKGNNLAYDEVDESPFSEVPWELAERILETED